MSIISLYNREFVTLPIHHQTASNGQNQNTNIDRYTAFCIGRWFPQRLLHCFRMRCRAVLLKSKGLSSQEIGEQTEMSHISVNSWVKRFKQYGITGLHTRPGRGANLSWIAQTKQRFARLSKGTDKAVSKAREDWQKCNRKRSERLDFQTFFISIGARYKRIRKRPRGIPSPQLYEYKTEKLQELEQLERDGKINLYFADESHVCTEGYVPYGWQFRNEDVYIPSLKADRLNIFGMIDRNNRYDGFCTTESIDADKVIDFLDRLSLKIEKNTFVVLDNASVHRNRKIKELRSFWEQRGLFLFYLPPYSPQLNNCRNPLENSEGQMDQTAGLYFERHTFLYCQQSVGRYWQRSIDQFQTLCCLILLR